MMRTCSSCAYGLKVSDKVQCTHPSKWGTLMSPGDVCKLWRGDE